jgi:hypothetical protein
MRKAFTYLATTALIALIARIALMISDGYLSGLFVGVIGMGIAVYAVEEKLN